VAVAKAYRLEELAARVGGRVRGDAARVVRGVAALAQAGPDDLSFLTNVRYRLAARNTAAGALLVGPAVDLDGRDLIEVAEPAVALAEILELFHPVERPRAGVSPDARIGAGATLGRGVAIGCHAVIGDGVALGDDVRIGAGSVVGDRCRVGSGTELAPRVVLYPGTEVGARCRIHAGVVLGADGFGYATSGGRHRKVPQVGRVVIEDDVEIGANTTIDRATVGETRIGRGTKIDDLVMVAHGVHVGPHSILVAQAGVAGSTRLGAGTVLAGQAGVAGHLEIGDGVSVAAKSAVFDDVPSGAVVAGIPAIDHRRWKRVAILVQKLPELEARVRELERRLGEAERQNGGRT
jgi:UDP-3-O-[3-hydroxymyristoyl] glucosamine N-acyltransferase